MTSTAALSPRPSRHTSLAQRFARVRAWTKGLCEPLCIEDFGAQSMPDVSPTKWHLAHTTWFFETFLLEPRGRQPVHPAYRVMFNSYYNGVGEQFARPHRGVLTRPRVEEVWQYRDEINDTVLGLLDDQQLTEAELDVVELGIHHEQQHQELLLTDIKHVFAQNPLRPAYERPERAASATETDVHFVAYEGRRTQIGHAGPGFAFDNETPRHDVLASPFALGSRLVTCGEYEAFVRDGGYRRPELWLSDGWTWRQQHGIEAPLYWLKDGAIFTLRGARARRPAEPVVHVSFYEADAFATWSDARLPREHELEIAARESTHEGNFVESRLFHPRAAKSTDLPTQLFGDTWTWTQSPYAAYPGYRPPAGAIGEYNGKFMCNQHVLRGGSCVSPGDHVRATYRNFFPAMARWQFTGIRLAKDLT